MMDEFDEQTRRVTSRTPMLTLDAPKIVVVGGPDKGQAAQLHQGKLRVGTAQGCSLRLRDSTVSRLHCEFEVMPQGVRLHDLGSTNGTYVGTTRVRDVDLAADTLIRVGATTLSLQSTDRSLLIALSERDRFGELLGGSVEMRKLYALLERAAPSDASLLIQGETGTGKEVVARSIHKASQRAAGPFVAIDCGAIAENLIESELFGHVRGAFSGAVADRRGVFEEADGGTLFFDEIGELPLSLQPKLLRALEAREIRRVGSNATRKVNVRVLAASNRPLSLGVNEGIFREDLYFRLAVFEVWLPPLRERREDIPRLAAHFFAAFSGSAAPLPAGVVASLAARGWPGNVRELRNAVERMVALGVPTSAPEGLQAPPLPSGLEVLVPTHLPMKEAREVWVAQFEQAYLTALLRKTGGNVSRAAALAGVHRRSLQRLALRVTPRLVDGEEGKEDGPEDEGQV